jgi:orotidine-5'-phosphate decarboxylase
MKPVERLIVALDVNDPARAQSLADELVGAVGAMKIGFELFSLAGPDFVRRLVDQGHRVFFDLKFHDIPNTVASAGRVATNLGAFMFNVHALGGQKMMRAAVEAAKSVANPPLVIAVTVLTSMGQSDLADLGISGTPGEVALALAVQAKQCGLDGVVASAQEAAAIKKACGEDFVVVTPGIRPAGADVGDQKRVMTPAKAIEQGASYLVVGRPIHGAPSPRDAALQIVEQISTAQ